MERFIPMLFARLACVNFIALRREMTVLERRESDRAFIAGLLRNNVV
jgi:hypothetical protein